MQNEIIVNAERGETRVAVLERSSFSELHIERSEDKSVVGSVVKGRVSRVLPGMQAAFVDIGLDKAAFLYAGDYFANGFTEESGEEGTVPTQPPNVLDMAATPPQVKLIKQCIFNRYPTTIIL